MYRALYRKWRPSTFDAVIGQQHITETLKRQIITGRYSHAYLFTGTRGTGKTSCAKILAKSLNCENPVNGNPCNCCPTCLGIDSGSILDVEELDAASNNGVDNVRALREEAVFSPVAAKKRVYIIDEVHMLSVSAFNALLKILEEPPEHLVFILATTELHKVPATVLSRCQRYSFKRIQPREIADYLKEIASREQIELTDEAAVILARLSDGSVRDSLSLLDQCSGDGVIDTERVLSAIGLAGNLESVNLLEKIFDHSAPEALSIFERLYENGKDVTAVLGELSALERDILLMKIAPNGADALLSGGYDEETLKRFAKMRSERALLSDIETVQNTLSEISKSSDRKISTQLCIIKLCGEIETGIETAPEVLKPRAKAPVSHINEVQEAPAPKMTSDSLPKIPISSKTEQPAAPQAPEKRPAAALVSSEQKQSVVSAPTSNSAGLSEYMELLRTVLDAPIYSLISDPSHVELRLSGNTLTLYTKSPFERFMLDNGIVPEKLKAASVQVFGEAKVIKIEELKAGAQIKEDKLDKLKKFDNIKFQ